MITIHLREGQTLADLIHELRDAAEPGQLVATGRGGVTVDDDLALVYLTALRGPNQPAAPAADATAGDADTTTAPRPAKRTTAAKRRARKTTTSHSTRDEGAR